MTCDQYLSKIPHISYLLCQDTDHHGLAEIIAHIGSQEVDGQTFDDSL